MVIAMVDTGIYGTAWITTTRASEPSRPYYKEVGNQIIFNAGATDKDLAGALLSGKMKGKSEVILRSANITNRGLNTVIVAPADLRPDLRELILLDAGIDEAGFFAFAGSPMAEKVRVVAFSSACASENAVTYALERMKQLEYLDFKGCYLADNMLNAIERSPYREKIKHIRLRFCKNVRDEDLARLINALPGLQELDLYQCEGAGPQTLAAITRHQSLKRLFLWGKLANNASVAALSASPMRLTFLSMTEGDLSDVALRQIAKSKAFDQLTLLEIDQQDKVSALGLSSLRELQQAMPKFRVKADFVGITKEQREALKDVLKQEK